MMNRGKLIKRLLVCIAITSSMSGCVWIEDTDDLMQFVAQVQARPSRPIKSLPAFKAYEAFIYEGTSLRNPFLEVVKFAPEIEDQELQLKVDLGDAIAPNAQRLKAYLENFAIKDLKMVGNISMGEEGNWGLIVDTNGEIHRVSLGGFMGFDHGKIVNVDASKIKLVETISNGRGGWITRPQSIELSETKGP
ncbi:MAG: type IV pilus assembly protein PilP [Oceanospirillaceae bacterium]|jgi:type IV pilus assembly protein PilP